MSRAALFETLAVWHDPVPREGPQQMACDEVLLQTAAHPLLRIFRWASPWVSAGYFSNLLQAQAVRPDLPVCRRWTGGGIVVHDGDITFALVVPRREPFAQSRPADSYLALHQHLAGALAASGVPAGLAADLPAHDTCFAGPVRHDVVAGGRKVAGGAQRRTRQGLLHQGSVQGIDPGDNFADRFAASLTARVDAWLPPADLEERIETLAARKYRTTGFCPPPRR